MVPTTEGAYINLTDQEFDQAKKQAETHLSGIQGEFREKNIESQSDVIYGPVVEGIINIAATGGRGSDRAGQSRPRGSFQSFLRQCCRRAIASCGSSPVDYQVPEFGVIAFQ